MVQQEAEEDTPMNLRQVMGKADPVDDVAGPAERIRAAVDRPYDLDGRKVVVTASIGVAISLADDEPDSLLSRADAAMYEAKTAGRNQVVVVGD